VVVNEKIEQKIINIISNENRILTKRDLILKSGYKKYILDITIKKLIKNKIIFRFKNKKTWIYYTNNDDSI